MLSTSIYPHSRHNGVTRAATSFVTSYNCSAACQLLSTREEPHREMSPIARKHFQLPSGSFLSTNSTVA